METNRERGGENKSQASQLQNVKIIKLISLQRILQKKFPHQFMKKKISP